MSKSARQRFDTKYVSFTNRFWRMLFEIANFLGNFQKQNVRLELFKQRTF